MLKKESLTLSPAFMFYAFLFIHLCVWTLAPAFMRFNLPLDTIEASIWGSELQWGYDKNPYFLAWVTAFSLKFSGFNASGTYLISQIFIALCFFSVWQLAKKMLKPLEALLAVFLLESIQYYHLHAIDLSDNSLEVGLWGCTIFFFYKAAREEKYMDWIATGFFSGLAIMTKYYTAVLLLPMALFLFFKLPFRKILSRPGIYCGIFFFSLPTLPHIFWLFSHDFSTFHYMIQRIATQKSFWATHLFFPIQFTLQQLQTLLLPALLLIPFLKKSTGVEKENITLFDQSFLFYMGILPFLLTIALSIIFGMKLRAAWGQPLFSLSGIIFIVWLKPHVTQKRMMWWTVLLLMLLSLTLFIYCYHIQQAKKPMSANFPGKSMAELITTRWHEQYHTPLKYVAGGRFLAGSIALYSNDHPKVYMDWDNKLSPWIHEADLKKNGAVFVWDTSSLNRRQEIPLSNIKKRFPSLENPVTLHVPWLRNKNLSALEIQVAFLSPSSV